MRSKWSGLVPHITIGILGVVAEIMLHDQHLKIAALIVAVLGIAVWHFLQYGWPVLRRNFRDAKNAHTRVDIIHKLNLHTRDEIVKQMPQISLVTGTTTSAVRCLPSLQNGGSADVRQLLEDGIQLLRTHVDYGVNVWGSIRELRADGKYHTVARAGEGFSPNRAKGSLPLDEHAMTIQQLRNSYNRKKCVLISGCNRGEELWTPQPNDRFGDDKCVLMGAVVVNSAPDQSPEDRLMVWVVCICSDTEDAFSSPHVRVMQGIVAYFSILANVVARQEWVKPPQSTAARAVSQ